jgi:hypothetical protein
MQFFTPQLYQQFNSRDEAVAGRANEEWDEAIQAYHRHLETIRPGMPSQVIALTELCLHDAEVLARSEVVQAGGPVYPHDLPLPFPISTWSAVAVVTVHLGGEILSLFYSLWDRVGAQDAPETWSFSKRREHWLYAAVPAHGGGGGTVYVHRILLSTGIVLAIPFLSVVVHRFPLPRAADGLAKQSA